MALHSYCRCWLHVVWTTLDRRPLLSKPAAVKLSGYLNEHSREKGIYMRINFVNVDHVHALIDLPTNRTIEDVAQLLKGSSSHSVNEQNLVAGKFAWQQGYGAFSVSHSGVEVVGRYIANQEAHHQKKSFAEELKQLIERHGLQWHPEENR